MNQERAIMLKEYELCEQFILSSSTRYFQLEALVLTVVWGGFVLFVTQTEPGPIENILVTCVGAMGAAAFSLYWMVYANRARFQEDVACRRARELERRLGMERRTVLWILERWDSPEVEAELARLDEEQPNRYSELARQVKRPWGLTRLPLGRFIGAAGVVAWASLTARAFLVHFGWL